MTAAPPAGETSRAAWQRLAVTLLWLTVAWNVGEGGVAVASGFVAGSVALVGFGLDSFIEVAAAAVMLWSLRAGPRDTPGGERERAAHRVIGATFLALAVYMVAESAVVLAGGGEPGTSVPGLVLAAASLVIMPLLGVAKRRNALRLGNRAMLAESTETLLCSYLSLTLLVGLAANAIAGWWWADVAAGLAMVPRILREALEGLRGEGDG